MADGNPSKSEIQTIFKKLRAVPNNKTCFDCNAKNPTWSSVTYGVFICIDCSAVHRSLGVHLTFVRSTQLDTNWTWLQLRSMQLGGNANASVFFRQHNCNTSDAQQKYTSRAAQLYKEKLNHAATQAMRLHGTKLHIESAPEKTEEPAKEVDFFEEQATLVTPQATTDTATLENNNQFTLSATTAVPKPGVNGAPSVVLAPASAETDRKSIIGGRKPPAKRGIGAKKGGLGAQRVQTDFAELEREAELQDKLKEKAAEEEKVFAERTAEEEQKQMASMRLAYQDLGLQQQKQQEKMKQIDPKKAQQVERLGMGFSSKSSISHSAFSDMQTIDQETPVSSTRAKTFEIDVPEDLDDYGFVSNNLGMYMGLAGDTKSYKSLEAMFLDRMAAKDRTDRSAAKDFTSMKGWNSTSDSLSFTSSFDEKPPERRQEKSERSERPRREPASASSSTLTSPTASNDAQKKFGNAKAISSDQYFGDSASNNWERKANLSRFEGSSSISSSDYFGDGASANRSQGGLTSSISAPDLDDVKESVRQGVTKVAGKISSLANGVLSSIQDRYGY